MTAQTLEDNIEESFAGRRIRLRCSADESLSAKATKTEDVSSPSEAIRKKMSGVHLSVEKALIEEQSNFIANTGRKNTHSPNRRRRTRPNQRGAKSPSDGARRGQHPVLSEDALKAIMEQSGTGVYIPGESALKPQPDATNDAKLSPSVKETLRSQENSDSRVTDVSTDSFEEEHMRDGIILNESIAVCGAMGMSEEHVGVMTRNKTKVSVFTDIQREQARQQQLQKAAHAATKHRPSKRAYMARFKTQQTRKSNLSRSEKGELAVSSPQSKSGDDEEEEEPNPSSMRNKDVAGIDQKHLAAKSPAVHYMPKMNDRMTRERLAAIKLKKNVLEELPEDLLSPAFVRRECLAPQLKLK